MAPRLRGDGCKMKSEGKEITEAPHHQSEKEEQSLRTGLGWPLPEGSMETRKEMGTELPEPL